MGYNLLNFKHNIMHTFLTGIDGCANSSLNGCDQICRNTIGSFVCECNTGYELNEDLMTCSGM